MYVNIVLVGAESKFNGGKMDCHYYYLSPIYTDKNVSQNEKKN